ncbi:p9 [Blackberry yellow vein-associated virus]|uniref:p9 n=1 Tax=Blackberry yellow vein-associated virus TaxID=404196 RepID=Q5ICV0_9CLOS|nr:p9 [Blackberry yellow vein-associated virus]AAV40969.1 p9 [Blackberry yellow vein-associated virus]
MDITQLMNQIGAERVNSFFMLVSRFGNDLPPTADVLLDIINSHFLDFSATRREIPLKFEDLKDFLICLKFIRDINLNNKYA